MVKRKATPAQLRALAKGRAKLKALRRGVKPKRKIKVRRRKNPSLTKENERLWLKVRNLERHVLAPPYTTKNAFFAESKTEQSKYYRWLQTQTGTFSDVLETRTPKKRRRNPGPPTRGAVMAKSLPGMVRGTTARRMTQQKVARKTIARYPAPKGQGGFRTNPPHYVIKGGKGYFDGAGWSTTKKGAAQYLSKQKAATIGQKIANATNKQVSVVAV